MRISDWSSDVGSSDLGGVDEVRRQQDARVGKTEVGRHAASERARVAAAEDVAVDIGRDRGHADDVAGIVHREVEKLDLIRAEARRVGNEYVSTCRSRGSLYP